MKIKLNEEHNSGYQEISVFVKLTKFIMQPISLLLIIDSCYPDGNKIIPTKHVYPVQFIASAKISKIKHKTIVVGFIDEETGKFNYWLMDLPKGYEQQFESARLVDYKGYLEVCDLTDVVPLKLLPYLENL